MPNNDYILRSDALKAILGVSIYDTIKELEGARTIAENTWADGLYDAFKIIDEIPAADVDPVRHAYWIDIIVMNMPAQACSNCRTFFSLAYTGGGHHYCPNCGAIMDADPPEEAAP